MNSTKIRVALVIGDNPDELIKMYDSSQKVEPYIAYRYLDSEKMQKTAIKCIQQVLSNSDKIKLSTFQKDYLNNQLKSISSLTPFEYYVSLTNGEYTFDEEGNAISDKNPKGKYSSYNIGGNFSHPLILIDGTETYDTTADKVNWDEINMKKEAVDYFDAVWSLVVENAEPIDERTKRLKNEWETRTEYLSNFKTKEDLIKHNCAYWTYAVITKDGWTSVDEAKNEDEWITSFMDRFIKPLTNEHLRIYEINMV